MFRCLALVAYLFVFALTRGWLLVAVVIEPDWMFVLFYVFAFEAWLLVLIVFPCCRLARCLLPDCNYFYCCVYVDCFLGYCKLVWGVCFDDLLGCLFCLLFGLVFDLLLFTLLSFGFSWCY